MKAYENTRRPAKTYEWILSMAGKKQRPRELSASRQPLSFIADDEFDWPMIEEALGRGLEPAERDKVAGVVSLQSHYLNAEKFEIDQESLNKLNADHGNRVQCDPCGEIRHRDGISLPLRAKMTPPFKLNLRQFAILNLTVLLEGIGFDVSKTSSFNSPFSGGQKVLKHLIDLVDPSELRRQLEEMEAGRLSDDPLAIANNFRRELNTIRDKIDENATTVELELIENNRLSWV